VAYSVTLGAREKAPGDRQEEVKVETAGFACLQSVLAGRLQTEQLMLATMQVARLVSLPTDLCMLLCMLLFTYLFVCLLNCLFLYSGRCKTGFTLA